VAAELHQAKRPVSRLAGRTGTRSTRCWSPFRSAPGWRASSSTWPARAPEQHFPVAVVALHGLLAATTLVLVLLTALGAGE
jgi:hypothetical protein